MCLQGHLLCWLPQYRICNFKWYGYVTDMLTRSHKHHLYLYNYRKCSPGTGIPRNTCVVSKLCLPEGTLENSFDTLLEPWVHCRFTSVLTDWGSHFDCCHGIPGTGKQRLDCWNLPFQTLILDIMDKQCWAGLGTDGFNLGYIDQLDLYIYIIRLFIRDHFDLDLIGHFFRTICLLEVALWIWLIRHRCRLEALLLIGVIFLKAREFTAWGLTQKVSSTWSESLQDMSLPSVEYCWLQVLCLKLQCHSKYRIRKYKPPKEALHA